MHNGAVYPNTPISNSLKNLAAMLRAEVGLQVATVDVGGWDTHTDEVNDLDNNLASFASSLSAFMTDLAPTGVSASPSSYKRSSAGAWRPTAAADRTTATAA